MTEEIQQPGVLTTMSGKDFSRLKEFISRECGIKITDSKKTMLEARLQKRLRKLNMPTFSRYCEYLFSPGGLEEELKEMIDQVTTNKTDFFREAAHFEYLRNHLLPELTRIRSRIAVWSAGCSSGEEAYTLAMILDNFGCDFSILATDISTQVLERARRAVYEDERVKPIPAEFRKKYLLSSKDRTKKLYRIVPELRERVTFKRLNFMDTDFGLRDQVDIIFCRNVIIYFDKPTQERLLNRFCHYLSPYGYIFTGHSETLLGMSVPLGQIAPTIYRKTS